MPIASASPDQTLPARNHSPLRLSFVFKVLAIIVLAILADFVLSAGQALPQVGSIIGFLAFAWLGALLACDSLMRRNRASRFAVIGASLAGFALIVEPSLLAGLLFLTGLALALLLPRHGEFGNALAWAVRLPLYGALSPMAALLDAGRFARIMRRRGGLALGGIAGGLLVAGLGSVLFLLLFSDANPLIGLGFAALWDALALRSGSTGLFWHGLFVLASVVALWASFRPLRLPPFAGVSTRASLPILPSWPGMAPVAIALAAFNLVFALQNASDIAFLWSGAKLPEGVTFSQYAHRGTQALVLAALLAAGFVLVCLRTGSPLAGKASVRLLVYLWIGQTMLLVASTMLRVVAYIEAYSLTYLRITALIFLFLVMTGLALISWRIARRRDGVWLINANALCLAIVLGVCCFINFEGVIARWNLERQGSPQTLEGRRDMSYVGSLGGTGALLPLKDAGAAADAAQSRDLAELRELRQAVQARLEAQQVDWRRWTLAGAWRLRQAGPLPGQTLPNPTLTPSP